jgi:hypothetical protein
MIVKIFAAIVAVALLLAYLIPIAWKMKEISMTVVMVIAVVMALVDLRQSLRGKEP